MPKSRPSYHVGRLCRLARVACTHIVHRILAGGKQTACYRTSSHRCLSIDRTLGRHTVTDVDCELGSLFPEHFGILEASSIVRATFRTLWCLRSAVPFWWGVSGARDLLFYDLLRQERRYLIAYIVASTIQFEDSHSCCLALSMSSHFSHLITAGVICPWFCRSSLPCSCGRIWGGCRDGI